MQTFRPDRVITVLARAVSLMWYLAWIPVIVVLVTDPIEQRITGDNMASNPMLTVDVRANLPNRAEVDVWGTRVGFDNARGQIWVPTFGPPPSFRIVTWTGWLFLSAIFLTFMYQLRRLFFRVREGAPFDVENVTRLRWLGALLIVYELLDSGITWWQSRAVAAHSKMPDMVLAPLFELDEAGIFVGVVLIALAEVFRRGAMLEEEQALTV